MKRAQNRKEKKEPKKRDYDDDDDDERSWKTSFRREMKINIILNVVKKGITDKIWMETLLDNVSTRPCFLSFARYALFFVVNFVNEDSQIFKNSMHPIFLFLSWKIFCRIIQFPFRRNCFPDVINSFFNTFVINFFHFFFLSINRSILVEKITF